MEKISGVYQITFSTGEFYIGKTVDFDRRREEHAKKLRTGTAARAMQTAADRADGIMNMRLLFECHPDHIDLIEDLFIAAAKRGNGKLCLNTTQRPAISAEDTEVLVDNAELLKLSTADHLRLINKLRH